MDVLIQRAHGCAGAVHRVGTDVDGEGISQFPYAISHPAFTVFVVLTGEGVFATEEGTADTAGYRIAYRDVGA